MPVFAPPWIDAMPVFAPPLRSLSSLPLDRRNACLRSPWIDAMPVFAPRLHSSSSLLDRRNACLRSPSPSAQQGEDIVPIPGTKQVKYLDDNLGAVNVCLTADDLAQIDAILPAGVAAGPRYSEQEMQAMGIR
jgi:hypothetical protein